MLNGKAYLRSLYKTKWMTVEGSWVLFPSSQKQNEVKQRYPSRVCNGAEVNMT
jgi:hypothetical protein